MSQTFANTIDGNDIYAKRAECDAAGNTLSTTYATKGELPTVDQTYDGTSTNPQSGTAVAGALASYTPTASLATVATTGDFDDLTSKPTVKPLVAGSNITITENANDITIAATGGGGGGSYTAGTGIDITNDVISVDTSVVATQTDLADKEDAFDVGTGLEMDTSGATPTLQVEAPVDIVAGPGIVIDNPDGNTLRVSVAHLDDWEDVSSEITKSTTIITGGSITFRYNKVMKMISMIGEIHVQGAGDVYTLPEKYRPQTNFTCANPGATSYIDYTPSNGKFVARSGANGYFSWTMTMPCLGE